MASNADTPRARALGAELRQARSHKGISTRKLAELIGRSGSHISRWETGKLAPTEADTATVLAVLGVRGSHRERLLELARDASDPNWVAPGADKQLAMLMEYERTASTITNVEPLMVPGLLQTYQYARHILSAFGAPRGQAETNAHMRIGRQHVLTDAPPKKLIAFIGESALRFPPCSHGVMIEQLQRLSQSAQRDTVTLHVLPHGLALAPLLCGSWLLIEFPQAKPVVHLEHFGSSTTLTDGKAVNQYRDSVALLQKHAMSPAESADFISKLSKQKEKS
ncbi:helix-turn-helix transcriptional regulator [Saccharopolyspora gloriosae]|uniref:Transcriptional regulator with XRE-family HTH domain n=1 Tax=Saccharopolyspora gloriosae TaxID=455344 RepID=A0A840NP51_9PSEU|nr:helix-turn-helix transcriptional regulator [Saccharopolyspora gloriosae]MBB5071059.1 transcriptional regulator with XRE-family HTH domain [Saccharopolyspora gloriosae]